MKNKNWEITNFVNLFINKMSLSIQDTYLMDYLNCMRHKESNVSLNYRGKSPQLGKRRLLVDWTCLSAEEISLPKSTQNLAIGQVSHRLLLAMNSPLDGTSRLNCFDFWSILVHMVHISPLFTRFFSTFDLILVYMLLDFSPIVVQFWSIIIHLGIFLVYFGLFLHFGTFRTNLWSI